MRNLSFGTEICPSSTQITKQAKAARPGVRPLALAVVHSITAAVVRTNICSQKME
jgi:hypothetical protein